MSLLERFQWTERGGEVEILLVRGYSKLEYGERIRRGTYGFMCFNTQERRSKN